METMLKNIKKDAAPVVSEEIIQHIEEDRQVNPEEGRKAQRLIFASALIAVIFVGTLVFSGVKIYKSYKNAKAAGSSAIETASGTPAAVPLAGFDEKELEKLIVPQTFSIDELSVPKKSGR